MVPGFFSFRFGVKLPKEAVREAHREKVGVFEYVFPVILGRVKQAWPLFDSLDPPVKGKYGGRRSFGNMGKPRREAPDDS